MSNQFDNFLHEYLILLYYINWRHGETPASGPGFVWSSEVGLQSGRETDCTIFTEAARVTPNCNGPQTRHQPKLSSLSRFGPIEVCCFRVVGDGVDEIYEIKKGKKKKKKGKRRFVNISAEPLPARCFFSDSRLDEGNYIQF